MLHRKVNSFKYAFKGIHIAYVEEANFQIELVLGTIAVLLGLYFDISRLEWLAVIGVCGLVLSAELLNTALEELCDMFKTSHDPHIAKIKDLAAGAVLIAGATALMVGILIFVPRIVAL